MLVRVTSTLRKADSPVKDEVKNVFHLITPTGDAITPAQATAWATPIHAFYNAMATAFSRTLDRSAGAQEISFAKVTTGGPGADDDVVQAGPLVRTYTLGAAIIGVEYKPMPPEVAICLSHVGYQVSPGEGPKEGPRQASRQRGRLYLGPWSTAILHDTTGAVADSFLSTVSNAWKNMVVAIRAIAAPNNADVGIYSPTSDTFWYDQSCYVDNAFDTVRSRGVEATLRVSQTMLNTNTGDPDAE